MQAAWGVFSDADIYCILFCICLTCLNQTQQWKRWIWPLTFQTNQYKSSTAWCFSALAPDNWSEILESNWTVEQLINPGAGSELLTTAATLEASVSSCRYQRGMLPCWLLECAAALNSTKSWRRRYKKSLLITTYVCVHIQVTFQLYLHFLENTNYIALKVLCVYICVCACFFLTYVHKEYKGCVDDLEDCRGCRCKRFLLSNV